MQIRIMTMSLVGVALLTFTTIFAQSPDQPNTTEKPDQKKCCQEKCGQGKCESATCDHGCGGQGKGGQGKGGHGKGGHGKGAAGQGHARQGHGSEGHGHDQRHDEDRELFHFLLNNHEKISREVTELSDGVETLTESEDPEIAAKIKEHVRWMQHRVEQAKPIRRRDPLFNEIFKHADKIEMKREETKNGVRVVETSKDPYVAKLIKAHAKAVSGFVSRGFAEARLNHSVPSIDGPESDTEPKLKEN